VTEQSEGGDKSSKASEEQLERANDELRDLQRELVAVTKERDEFKALIQELEKKNASLTHDDHQTEEYEDMKSQLLANKITVQQNKKLNELLQKRWSD
jgi:predicted choloylglycine hydrolase